MPHHVTCMSCVPVHVHVCLLYMYMYIGVLMFITPSLPDGAVPQCGTKVSQTPPPSPTCTLVSFPDPRPFTCSLLWVGRLGTRLHVHVYIVSYTCTCTSLISNCSHYGLCLYLLSTSVTGSSCVMLCVFPSLQGSPHRHMDLPHSAMLSHPLRTVRADFLPPRCCPPPLPDLHPLICLLPPHQTRAPTHPGHVTVM